MSRVLGLVSRSSLIAAWFVSWSVISAAGCGEPNGGALADGSPADGPPDGGPPDGGPPDGGPPDGPDPIAKLAQRAYAKAVSPDVDDHFGAQIALSGDGQTLAVSADREDSASIGIDGDARDNSASNAGAVYVFTRSARGWVPQAYVKASNTDADDRFGISLALSRDGSTLVVGARGESSAATGVDGAQQDNSAIDAGAAYVFTRTSSGWAQQAYLKASNTEAGDNFGSQVALSADGATLAVAAENEGSSAIDVGGDETDNTAPLAGAVYLFARTARGWTQEAYVKASNTEEDDFFGSTLALSGDGSTLAVAAAGEASAATGVDGDPWGNSQPWSGAVYVFFHNNGLWKQQAYVKASNTRADDAFGGGLSLSDDGAVLAVGASGEDSAATGVDGDQLDDSASNAGAVYVLQRSSDVWDHVAYLKSSNAGAIDLFGRSVSLSGAGAVLAVGAIGEDSSATGVDGNQLDETGSNSGAVYLFHRGAGTWAQRSYVKASNADRADLFGGSVALSADGATVAAGAVAEASAATGIDGNQDDNSRATAGAAYVFR